LQEHLGAYEEIIFQGCSEEVDKALAADVMKSVKYLLKVVDLLDNLPILLYQGEPQLSVKGGRLLCDAHGAVFVQGRWVWKP